MVTIYIMEDAKAGRAANGDFGTESLTGSFRAFEVSKDVYKRQPQHTRSAQAAWTLPTGVKWLGDVVLQAGVRCAGRIWWNEENTLSQPFYALARCV